MSDWLETCRGVVLPQYCDHFGHMNVRYYGHAFDDAGFHVWSLIGMGLKDIEARGIHTVVASFHIDFVREITAGELWVTKGGFVRVGTKSCTHRQKMFNADTGVLHAVNEVVEVFFDPKTRKAAPMPDDIRARVEAALVDPDGP